MQGAERATEGIWQGHGQVAEPEAARVSNGTIVWRLGLARPRGTASRALWRWPCQGGAGSGR